MALDLPPRDQRVHVFAVTGEGPPIPHQTYLGGTAPAGEALRAALGADEVDTTHAEVFAASDIAPMSVRDYVAQAHDVPQANMAGDADALDTLAGDVVVLAPRAVERVRRLDPGPGLRHVGAYPVAEADDTPRELPPAAREPRLAEPERRSSGPAMSRGTILAIVLAGLAVAALVVLTAL